MRSTERRNELEGSGYSLWLMPQSGTKSKIESDRLITRLASIHGTPAFQAHVTLVGSIQEDEAVVRNLTQKIASILTPYELEGNGTLATEPGKLHKVLFTPIQSTNEVQASCVTAQKVLGKMPEVYSPHISWAYDDLTPEEVEILARMIMAESDGIMKTKFSAHGISLWRTEGLVRNWQELAFFPFGTKY